MRLLMLLFCMLVVSGSTAAQESASAARQEERRTSFMFDDFKPATLLMKSGASLQARFNYNMVSEEMVFLQNNLLMALDMPGIDTIYVGEKKFVPFGASFYEVIKTPECDVFVRHRLKISNKGKPAGYGGYSETSAITMLSSITIMDRFQPLEVRNAHKLDNVSTALVKVAGQLHEAGKLQQLQKAFPHHKEMIKAFAAENKLRVFMPEDVLALLEQF